MIESVATLGSHCALQVLKGAKDEGFRTVVVTKRGREGVYRRFGFIDEFLVVEEFREVASEEITEALKGLRSVLVPHGTLISEVGVERAERLGVPIFGNRWLLRWEADRELKGKLMREAGFELPREFSSPEEIDRLCIVKRHGAAGGRGYFLAWDKESYEKGVEELKRMGISGKFYIQEYVLGVPAYLHFFYSPLSGEVELLGADIRYESDVDALGRIPAECQRGIKPGYTVVGNIPLVLRESLLEKVFELGEGFVDASKRLVPPGVIGPFCIEGVFTKEARFVAFEFSARIVAGTNLYIDGSPYSSLLFGKPVSMGRRIAMELRKALDEGRIEEVLT